MVRAPTFAELSNAVATATLGGLRVITFNPVDLSGFRWDPLVLAACAELSPCPPAPPSDFVPGDVAVYHVAAAQLAGGKPFLVAGEPGVDFWMMTFAHRV